MPDANVVPISRSEATDPGCLADLAHEINVRIQKADDHRLSASLKLAEAKAACKTARIPFKGWVSREIKQLGYTEATRLAKIGAAPDPAKALADHRAKTLTRTRETREKVALRSATPAALADHSAPPARGKDVVCARVRDAISALSGLPNAAEVVGYFRGSDQSVLVDEHLPAAVCWLDEFETAWSEANAAEDAD